MNTYPNSLIFSNVDFSYNTEYIFKHLNLELEPNRINVIIGKSGSGKSTLLKLLLKQIECNSGEILNNNVKDISYLSQVNDLLPWYSMRENIAISLKIKGRTNAVADELIDTFKLRQFENEIVDHLSGGQIKRFALIRTFSLGTNWIFLDEPFANLDYFTRNELYAFLQTMQKHQNKSIVLITHDLDEALLLADALYIIKDQSISKFDMLLTNKGFHTIFDDAFIKLKREISLYFK